MTSILNKVGRLLGMGVDPAEAEARREALAVAFQKRCGQFRMLIASNNQALEIMAELEEALSGQRHFGMSWIKARCASVMANVYKMVRCLNEMTGDRHAALHQSLGIVHRELSALVERAPRPEPGPLALPLATVDGSMAARVGPKMANLGEVGAKLGLAVPDGFVVTADGYRLFMDHDNLGLEIDRLVQCTEAEKIEELEAVSAEIRDLVRNAEIPPELRLALSQGCEELRKLHGDDVKLALRSSALGEDLPGASFAGQFHTELLVGLEDVPRVYKDIVASNFGLAAMGYRFNRGIPEQDVVMCVGCLVMVDAAAGGVLYTRDPMDFSGERMVINAVPGLPKDVVDGSVDPEITTLTRADPPVVQPTRPGKGDTRDARAREEEPGREPCLDQGRVLELARAALEMERHFGHELDIEWALDKAGQFVILQARHVSKAEAHDFGNPAEGLEVLLAGGVAASPGIACGPACVVRDKEGSANFPKGGVLVIAQALPRWAMLLARASAVIAETGSPAGHLGNVAREFGVPAVFGVKGAVERLAHAGDVTLDADRCTVHAGIVDLPPARKPDTARELLLQSPVSKTLEAASALVVPLSLLDPDSRDFTPENCRTLHDITRYCHEKSVSEMFSPAQGKDAWSASKRLYYHAPLKYWIIDLGNGFKNHVRGKYVRIPEIASKPMLALWEGMLAVPWDGPPAMDAKGFLSVIGQAASNPELDPTRRSAFEIRNYFMISDTFVSLQARYGFHFCTVEGLVSNDEEQNYVLFRFKGGAADLDRRELRAEMVADILEEQGFRTEVKQDAVSARAEGMDAAYMLKRLEILGYIIIHTKQLDMIMKNPSAVAYHRRKINEDLKALTT